MVFCFKNLLPVLSNALVSFHAAVIHNGVRNNGIW